MGKITDLGLAKPDDPMFSTGPEVFSPRAFNLSSSGTADSKDGVTPAKSDSATGKLPDPPERKNFKTQEAFEEAMGRWQETVGRIKAMAERARRSKGSSPESQ